MEQGDDLSQDPPLPGRLRVSPRRVSVSLAVDRHETVLEPPSPGFLIGDYDGSREYDFTNPDLMPLDGDQSESDPEH